MRNARRHTSGPRPRKGGGRGDPAFPSRRPRPKRAASPPSGAPSLPGALTISTAPTLLPLAAAAPSAVEALLDAAFGTDRHTRTAYRLREGSEAVAALSLSAWRGAALVGVLQCWPVALATDTGAMVPMVLVGPVAVDPGMQRGGAGDAMMRHMLAAADASADPHADVLTMIGDAGYYGRFGFDASATAGWRMPGPWDPGRLLARGAGGRAAGLHGLLVPR